MKSLVKGLFAAAIFTSVVSCGTGGNADSGASVLLEIDSIIPSFLDIDLVEKRNNDNDTICDECYIPIGDSVDITFRSIVPENSTIQPSDISIVSYTVTYIPKTKDVPVEFRVMQFPGTCLIPAGQTRTCTFPIFLDSFKKTFYIQGWADNYDLKITIKAKEIIYDKTLTITGYTTVRLSDIVQEGEANCTCPLDKIQIGN